MKKIFLTLFLCLALVSGAYGSGFMGGSSGSGDVAGPASSTDNAIARFHLTTGKILQNGLVTIDDDGTIRAPGAVISGPLNIGITGSISEETNTMTFDDGDGTPVTLQSIRGAIAAGGVDWTADQGATNIHAGNIPDLSGTYLAKAVYDAYSILMATTDDTPVALTVAEQRVVGRVTGQPIAALTLGAAAGNVFQVPADPNATKVLGWNDTSNVAEWVDASGTGDVTGPASPTAGYLTKWGPTGKALVDGPKLGTLTDTKWCTYTAADGLKCTEDSPAGSGDVTGVGDCSGGACLDGSSYGGTYIQLYDGTSSYTKMLAGVRLFTLSSGLANSEDITFTLGNNDNTVTLTSSTGADSIIGLTSYSLGAAGVKLTGDGDGALTILGLGNGYDESLTFNFDDVENTVGITSATGVTTIDASTLELKALKFTSGAADGERYINVDNSAAYRTTGPAEGDISCKADTDTCARYNGSTWVALAFKSDVISQPITGYSSGAGTVADTDTILQAINKLNGNTAAKQNTVTEGSLADSVIVSADIKDGEITTSDMATATAAKVNRYHQTAHIDPDNQYATYGGVIVLDPKTAAAITLTEIYVVLNENPTQELTVTCYHKTAAVGYTGGTTIDANDTDAGTFTATSFDDATIPAGSKVWCVIGDNPDATTLHMEIALTGTYD